MAERAKEKVAAEAAKGGEASVLADGLLSRGWWRVRCGLCCQGALRRLTTPRLTAAHTPRARE